jgi:hypothetical protein
VAEELTPVVVAPVDHDATIGGQNHLGVLMLEAARAGVLDRCAPGIGWVNLYHPAGAMRLFRGLRDIEPIIPFVINIAPTIGADAIMFVSRVDTI